MSNREAAAASERPLPPLPTERFAKLNAHKAAFFQALADLVGIPSRGFKGHPDEEWIRREDAMRLVLSLRDHGSALATLLREELSRAASAPQAVRMLTAQEVVDAMFTDYGQKPMSRAEALQRKFCEVNGLGVPLAPQDSTKEGGK